MNKPDKQDPTAPAKDFRPIGSGEPYHKIAQNPMAREMNSFFAPRLAKVGQFGLSPDGITAAGIIPAIVLEMGTEVRERGTGPGRCDLSIPTDL